MVPDLAEAHGNKGPRSIIKNHPNGTAGVNDEQLYAG
jgi:hypothetical protein